MSGILQVNDFRRAIRAPVNPMDKSTVVSIYPKHIIEKKPTIQPGVFEIQPGSYENPSILVVGPSSWWRDIDEHQPLLEIPNSSVQIADSIVRDYCIGIFCCDMATAQPGLFYIPGVVKVEELRTKYLQLLNAARDKQKVYYQELVKITSSLWSRSNGNILTVSDEARLAAHELGLQPEWAKDTLASEMVRCIACGALRNPDYPVCQVCKAVADPDKAKKLGLQFAS